MFDQNIWKRSSVKKQSSRARFKHPAVVVGFFRISPFILQKKGHFTATTFSFLGIQMENIFFLEVSRNHVPSWTVQKTV